MTEKIEEKRFCLFCKGRIPSDRRKDAKFCGDVCKSRNFERKNPDRKRIKYKEKTQNKGIEGVGIIRGGVLILWTK